MDGSGSDPVDDLLVLRMQDGDRASVDELVRRWQKRLWMYALRISGDADAAWEVTQQTWLAIIKGIDGLDDPSRFRTWAFRIVSNKAIDYRRRGLTHAGPERAGPAVQEHDLILRDILDRMEPEKKALLLLYYVEGFSVHEIGGMLHLPDGTVKSRLHASRASLRSMWLKVAEEEST